MKYSGIFLRQELHIAPCRGSSVLLALALVGCQFSGNTQRMDALPIPVLSDAPLPPHPLSGLAREHIVLRDTSGNTLQIVVEIADEPEAQSRGLMGRDALGPYEGMLFVFPEEAPRGFWMKDTLIPLDILFFNAEGKWVYGVTMTPCEADPCAIYDSRGPAKYALEMRAGFIEEEGGGGPFELKMEN